MRRHRIDARPAGPVRWTGLALVGPSAVVVLALGCPGPTGRGTDQPPPANRVRPGHAPTPFAALDIRKACPSGHFRRYLVEVPGQPSLQRTLTFEDVTEDSVEFTSIQVDGRGRPFGEQRRLRARWKALQAHASFPRAHTRIRKVTVTTLGGSFEAWRYEVRSRGGLERERYWFALALPGPPVQYERHVEGKLQFRMTLVAHGRRAPGRTPATMPEPAPTPGQAPSPGPAPPAKKRPTRAR